MSTSKVCIVHEVVVQQRVVVISLQSASRWKDAFGVVFEHVVCQHHERRSYSLSPDGKDILDGLVKALRLPVIGNVVQVVVDEL